jgi:hypothetical protein
MRSILPARKTTGWACSLAGGCALAVATISAPSAQDLRPLEAALRDAGYQLYNPPRANWGPGFVFAGDVIRGRITNVEEICPNLYADIEAPQGAAVILPNYSAKDSFTFGLALRFLKGLIGAEADLGEVEREKSIDVKWQNLRETSYTLMDQWLEKGEPRPISKLCRLAIDDLKAKDRFNDRVFVIVRAVAPESLIYDFAAAYSAKGSASANFAEKAQAKTQGSVAGQSSTQLEIKQRLFIGYAPPVKLRSWLPSGLVSGEIVEVKGEPSNLMIE